jgi:aspartyl-tRNA(Asn)/glutamyl-tRNA(Gln) amidotransferase subunit C
MVEKLITKEQVVKIAELCKLELTKEEVEKFSKLFSETLKVIAVLDELDTPNVKETYQVNGLMNVFQKDDENVATLTQKEVLKNAKKVEKGLIATDPVFDR